MNPKHTDRSVLAVRKTPRKQVALIGGTSGLGRKAVDQLVALGHRLVVVGRNARRGAELAGPETTFVATDISTLDGMTLASSAIRDWAEPEGRLDVLINNAGVMRPRRELTEDGLEMNFAVHHVAPFVVTGRLFDLLAPGGRVVNVNSVGHMRAMRSSEPVRIRFDDLRFDHDYEPSLAYSRSKLANLMFTYELHRRYGDRVTANALHPGQVRTDLGRDFPRALVMGIHLMGMAVSPARGARPVVHLALSDEGGRAGGRYFDRFTETRSSAPSYDKTAAARLWELTEQLAGRPFISSQSSISSQTKGNSSL